jgi:hypothetical protein
MRQISSKLTWWQKKAFPSIWFGYLAVFTCVWIVLIAQGQVPAESLLIPLGLVAVGGLLTWWLVWRLVDEVWIDGDDIVVRNGRQNDRFPIANIVDVDGSYLQSPEHIGLWLNQPCRFGKVIRFGAPFRLFPFGTHSLARELIERSGCFERGRSSNGVPAAG